MPSIGKTWVLASIGAVVEMGVLYNMALHSQNSSIIEEITYAWACTVTTFTELHHTLKTKELVSSLRHP
jgi:hypothetical protein